MGRSESWVKNNWKKILKKENIDKKIPIGELKPIIIKLMGEAKLGNSLFSLSESCHPSEIYSEGSKSFPNESNMTFGTIQSKKNDARSQVKEQFKYSGKFIRNMHS